MLSKFLRAVAGNSVTPPTTDPNFKQVSLLLHGDGTNGAQNNTFLDSSTNNFTVTRNGTPTQGTNTPFSQPAGYWSNYFNPAIPDFLRIPVGSYALAGDFTIECWAYQNDTTDRVILSSWKSVPQNLQMFRINEGGTTGAISVYFNNDGYWFQQIGTGFTSKTWHHVALTRSGLTARLYLDGVLIATKTLTAATSAEVNLIGAFYLNGSYSTAIGAWNGHISNVRVLNGTALYTGSTYTVPTTALTAITNTSLLTCQSNYFKDNSSNNFALTVSGTPSVQPWSPFAPTSAYSTSVNGGSMYFNGTTDYLTFTQQSFATDFTAECWFYRTATGTVRHNLFSTSNTGYDGTLNCQLAVDVTGAIFIVLNGAVVTGFNNVGGNAVPIGSWSHVVFVRSGTNLSVFVNGARIANGTSSDTLKLSSIGAYNYGTLTALVNGYVSNARITNTAVYSPAATTITVPTAPLTAITNTSLLLSGTNAGIYDNAIKNDLVTVGNAQVSTSVKKYGTGSMYFDGTGDWLTSPDTPNLQLGTGNFTIEGWVYLNAVGAARGFVSKGTSTTGWSLGTNSSNQVVFSYASSTITSTGTLSVSTWYFVTVVREGTSTNQTKIYINGTNDGTGTVSTDFNQTNILYVGADRVGGSALNGYIDDLRVTKGIARYTATFTPPTQAFPNQ